MSCFNMQLNFIDNEKRAPIKPTYTLQSKKIYYRICWISLFYSTLKGNLPDKYM